MPIYYIKEDKIEELKDGRTIAYISKILGITPTFLRLVFNGEKCKKMLAMSLINLKDKIPFNSLEMEEKIKYYFDEK